MKKSYDKIVQERTNDALEASDAVRKHRLEKVRQMKAEFLAKKQLREEETEFNKEEEKKNDQ